MKRYFTKDGSLEIASFILGVLVGAAIIILVIAILGEYPGNGSIIIK